MNDWANQTDGSPDTVMEKNARRTTCARDVPLPRRAIFAAWLLASLLLFILPAPTPSAQPADAPNILFISADDLNDWVGCLGGHPQAITPNIDRLARRGVLFTNAHCTTPVCNPSRNAILTGMHAFRTDLYTNGENLHRLRPDLMTLPRYLRRNGYRTFGTGKVFHSVNNHGPEDWDDYGPNAHTAGHKGGPFTTEEMLTRLQNPSHRVERLGVTLPLNGLPIDRPRRNTRSFDWGPVDVPDDQMSDVLAAEWAIERLGQSHDAPFFLAVGFYRPHIPLYVPSRYFDLFPPEKTKLPDTIADDLKDVSRSAREIALLADTAGRHSTVVAGGQWRHAVAAYLACVNFVDDQVGKLLDALDAGPYAENTVIVFWSDHGWHLGEKEHWGKFTAWEPATRVPLIIVPPRRSAPEGFEPGTRSERPVSLIDLYPTLLAAAGVEPRDGLDGHDLAPLLQNPVADWPHPAITTFGRGNFSIRFDRSRYVRYFDGTEELYDLTADPNEWTNLAAEPGYASALQRMTEFLPRNERIKHTVRYGKWKAVLLEDGGALLFDHSASPGFSDRNDVAGENPEVVERIREYLSANGIRDRAVFIP